MYHLYYSALHQHPLAIEWPLRIDGSEVGRIQPKNVIRRNKLRIKQIIIEISQLQPIQNQISTVRG